MMQAGVVRNIRQEALIHHEVCLGLVGGAVIKGCVQTKEAEASIITEAAPSQQ